MLENWPWSQPGTGDFPSDDWNAARGPRRIDDLDGFYVDLERGRCVLATVESADTIVLSVWDTAEAAFDGEVGDVKGDPVVINLRTGRVMLELPVTEWRWPFASLSALPLRALGEMVRWWRLLRARLAPSRDV